ncbi:ATP-dependent RecD-like DNA helicase [compost metagenome]
MAWRNRRVDDINKAIRTKIYGKGAARFEIGERVVTGAPIGNGEETLLSTDEECEVTALTESYVLDEATNEEYKTWLVALRPLYADVSQVFAHVLHEDDQERYNRQEAKLRGRALDAKGSSRGLYWRRFHEFRDLFSTIRYCYCITIHRSQGSTYQTAIVDVKDLLENDIRYERQRLTYVGFSRPQWELVINKTSFTV